MARHNDFGQWGENIACETLIQAGYTIVERNWRMKHYEIDIIAAKGNRIVFVEVKTRKDSDCDPLEAIDRRKISHMARSADAYLKMTGLPHEAQFDLIGITGTPDEYKVEHVQDAFWPPIKTY